MSAIQQLKNRFNQGSANVNTSKDKQPLKVLFCHSYIQVNDNSKLLLSKSRSVSSHVPSHPKQVSHTNLSNQAHYQNLSRKAFQPITAQNKQLGKSQDPKQDKMKKIKLAHMMLNPIDDISKEVVKNAPNNQERETTEQPNQKQEVQQEDKALLALNETLSKIQQKIHSAQRKMNFAFGGKAQVSTFEPVKKEQHNSDQLVKTEDHSDIKHSQKALFNQGESTAPMTAKASILSTTPAYEASQFTLNVLGESSHKTPVSFKNQSGTPKTQDTDEQGNRMSILPSHKRPRVPSAKKEKAKSPRKSAKKAKAAKETTENVDQIEEFKNPLEKMKDEVKVIQQSKPISKNNQQVRQNFVKMNMNSYKPRMRGAAFSNKIMAKKRNQMKFRDRMQKKFQIERAKNRDQVNIYGGLGKVGFDHNKVKTEGEEDLVPGFSASAMKYVKDIIKEEEVEDIEEFLVGGLEDMDEELEKIDEEIKEEESFQEPEEVNFDKPLYKNLPKTDEEYAQILKERFGHTSFKEGQLEALKILLEKKENSLVVLATGGGKSLVYQYASMFLPGLILIVTPLISLMTDQLGKLPEFIPGAALNSQQNYQMKKQIMQATVEKKIKVLFISPERFFIEDFTKFNRKISLVCVDEIHCASEWSHNFRPAYLKINDMIREKVGPDSVMLGLTATATKATQRSICEVFNVRFPEHIVTQNDLSRFNLQLSITRDHEKQRGLIQMLKSESFKNLDSILIFATHKRTCDQLAQYLTQQGINSQSYHAGKTDQQRQAIQKLFINNQIRALVCTIAFSMGIDKSDIQSVIHYDMPKSIENYVQEIGRAGRDGKLARCHMFLNNEDFFLIRRLIFTDLLDNYNALKLTNKIIVEAKRSFTRIIHPEIIDSKKRRKKQITKSTDDGEGDEFSRIIEEFEHEELLNKCYEKNENGIQRIEFDKFEEITSALYVFLDAKETCSILDLKREVVMTMLNSLEKLPEAKRFFKFEGVLPGSVGVRFHKSKPGDHAAKNEFLKLFLDLSKEHQGVYRCSIQKLAYGMNISPFQIPKIFYNLQNSDDGEITYEMDQECFVLKMKHIPYGGQTLDLAQEMLNETRRIEKNMIQKLNCMYFIARRVSMPSVENMLKKEKTEDYVAMYKGFTKQLNELINLYFSIQKEDEMEVQIAGSEEERNIMMPLIYVDSHREKANIESSIKIILRDFHDQGQGTFDPNERMKPLDVVKIMMGIYSERGNIKRFMNDSKVWAKFQEYDYEDIYKVAQSTVNQFYVDHVSGGTSSKEKDEAIPSGNISKKRKLND